MNLPSLKQLQYLIALRENGSFSKAAETCYVTQSTLSAGIKELENILGQPVVDRSRKKPALTPFGQEIAKEAETVLATAQKMSERARQIGQPMSGPLRFGIIPTIAPYMLPNILPRIQSQFPQLELRLHEDLTDRLLEKLERGTLDLALLAFPYKTPGMEQKILFEEPFTLAHPQNTYVDKDTINVEDLKPNELLLLEDGHCLRDHALEACGLQTTQRRQEFSATSLATLLHMVASGYGSTLLPAMAAAPEALPPSITITTFNEPKPTRQIGLAWRAGAQRRKDYETLGALITVAT